jgi:hypothetical protein
MGGPYVSDGDDVHHHGWPERAPRDEPFQGGGPCVSDGDDVHHGGALHGSPSFALASRGETMSTYGGALHGWGWRQGG